jgi:carboxymethylenebutenolidase
MAYHGYLTSEVVEDCWDGLISRREALRRLALLGVSASVATASLVATSGPAVAQSPQPGPSAQPSPSGPVPALPPGAPGLPGGPITFPGPRGDLLGHLSEAPDPAGGVLVIHENRGLTDHIRSVADRFAAAGYTALAIDLLSEEGGSGAIADEGEIGAMLGSAAPERLVDDMRAGLDELERRLPGAGLGIVGFCFGGGMVWALLDAGDPRLEAAIPFYGPAPDAPDFAGNEAAVLGVYAEDDDRVNASRERVGVALEAAGLTHQINIYPGAGHGFFNDTGGRHDPIQAAAAWSDALEWFGEHLSAGPAASPSVAP